MMFHFLCYSQFIVTAADERILFLDSTLAKWAVSLCSELVINNVNRNTVIYL